MTPRWLRDAWDSALSIIRRTYPQRVAVITFGSLCTGEFASAQIDGARFPLSDLEFMVVTLEAPDDRLARQLDGALAKLEISGTLGLGRPCFHIDARPVSLAAFFSRDRSAFFMHHLRACGRTLDGQDLLPHLRTRHFPAVRDTELRAKLATTLLDCLLGVPPSPCVEVSTQEVRARRIVFRHALATATAKCGLFLAAHYAHTAPGGLGSAVEVLRSHNSRAADLLQTARLWRKHPSMDITEPLQALLEAIETQLDVIFDAPTGRLAERLRGYSQACAGTPGSSASRRSIIEQAIELITQLPEAIVGTAERAGWAAQRDRLLVRAIYQLRPGSSFHERHYRFWEHVA